MAKRTKLRLMAAAVIVVLIGSGSAWAVDLTDGLVAHWTFDDGSGNIASDDVGGNDGTIYGAEWTEGLFGGALSFNGNGDYISIFENTLPEIGPYSVSLWLYKDGNYQGQYIAGGHDQNANWIYYYINENARFTLGTKNRGSGRIVIRDSDNQTFENYRPANDQWTHVVVVFDPEGKAVKLYRDALDSPNYYMVYSGYTDSGWGFSGTDTVIGRLGSGSTYYSGLMDDVRIYNKALSESEVQQLYQSSLPALESLEIVGAEDCAEDSQGQYKAIAHYDNNSTTDVTDSVDCVWSVEPNSDCNISAGLLRTQPIDMPADVTIRAEYSEDGNTVEAEKDVSIFAICPSGSALEFDGDDDYVDCSSTFASVTASTTKTIMGWAKSDVSVGPQRIITLYRKIDYSAFIILAEGNPATWQGYYATPSNGSAFLDSGVPVTENEWAHVALVQDGANVSIYINGTLLNTSNDGAAPVLQNPPNSTIGAFVGDFLGLGVYFCFNGTIDDVRIYDRALSAEEIQGFIHTRSDTNDPNLVAYWDLDESEGQEAGDSSGNGNDGVLGDVNTPDDSDPNWTDSVPPVGICSMEGIVERNLLDVLGMKNNVLDLLDAAIGKEEALWEYMDIMFKDRDFGDTGKGDVVKAKQKIHSAIQAEVQAETAVEKSLEKLDEALTDLDIEIQE